MSYGMYVSGHMRGKIFFLFLDIANYFPLALAQVQFVFFLKLNHDFSMIEFVLRF